MVGAGDRREVVSAALPGQGGAGRGDGLGDRDGPRALGELDVGSARPGEGRALPQSGVSQW